MARWSWCVFPTALRTRSPMLIALSQTSGQSPSLCAFKGFLLTVNDRHGTGHGVGHFLNVHEGPHGIGVRIGEDLRVSF